MTTRQRQQQTRAPLIAALAILDLVTVAWALVTALEYFA